MKVCEREEGVSDGGCLGTSGRSMQGKGPNNPLFFQGLLPPLSLLLETCPKAPENSPMHPRRLASDR